LGILMLCVSAVALKAIIEFMPKKAIILLCFLFLASDGGYTSVNLANP